MEPANLVKRANPFSEEQNKPKAQRVVPAQRPSLSIFDHPVNKAIRLVNIMTAGLEELKKTAPFPIRQGFRAKVLEVNKLWHGMLKTEGVLDQNLIRSLCAEILLQAEKFSEVTAFKIRCGSELILLNSFALNTLILNSEFFEKMLSASMVESTQKEADMTERNLPSCTFSTICTLLSTDQYIDIPDDQVLSFLESCQGLNFESLKPRVVNILLSKISSSTFSLETLLDLWQTTGDAFTAEDRIRIKFECELQIGEILRTQPFTQDPDGSVIIESKKYKLPETLTDIPKIVNYLRTNELDPDSLLSFLASCKGSKPLLIMQVHHALVLDYDRFMETVEDPFERAHGETKRCELILSLLGAAIKDNPISPFLLKQVIRFYNKIQTDRETLSFVERCFDKLFSIYNDRESILLRAEAFMGYADFDAEDDDSGEGDPNSSKTRNAYFILDKLNSLLKYNPNDSEAMFFRILVSFSFVNFEEKRGLSKVVLLKVLIADMEKLIETNFDITNYYSLEKIQIIQIRYYQIYLKLLLIKEELKEGSSDFGEIIDQIRENFKAGKSDINPGNIWTLTKERVQITEQYKAKFKRDFPYSLDW